MTIKVVSRSKRINLTARGKTTVQVVRRGRQGATGSGGLTQIQIEALIDADVATLKGDIDVVRRVVAISETYTPASTVNAITFEAVGGGGGGSGFDTSASQHIGSGGSGGAFLSRHIEASDLDPQYSITIGAGGTAGARSISAPSTQGGVGQSTSISGVNLGTLDAKGGFGGGWVQNISGNLIVGPDARSIEVPTGTFDFSVMGNPSQVGMALNSGMIQHPDGGASHLGHGGYNAAIQEYLPGFGGGGGGSYTSGGGGFDGQVGGSGAVIITEFHK